MKTLFDLFQKTKHFVFDVDGVFTNSQLICHPSGDLLRIMNARDGYAVKLALRAGYDVAIITGGNSPHVKQRFLNLGVTLYYDEVKKKLPVFEALVQEQNWTLEHTLYMGDDLPDCPVLKQAGISCCPADAADDILGVCRYVSAKKGGQACVREVIEKVMKLQETWPV